MVSWRGLALLALTASAALVSSTTEAATKISIRVSTTEAETVAKTVVDDSTKSNDLKDCEINGIKLRHRTLHYYADKAYVACKHGIAACYLQDRHHDHASQVSCPHKNLQEKIDEYAEEESRRRRLSLAVVDSNRKWANGVVCYSMNAQYPFDATQKGLIADAMKVYEKETNIRFLPQSTCKTNKLTSYCNGCADYVDFKHPTTGRDCNSSIGVNGAGGQIMFLADRCFEGDGSLKNDYGSAMHEIGHSLGLYHEHQHPQRQVAVFWDDIPTSIWGEMKIRDVSVGGAYDADSVMHYPDSYGFCYPKFCTATLTTGCVPVGSKFCNLNDDTSKCVEPNKNLCDETKTKAIGQRRFLSQGDLDALNELYKQPQWSASASQIVM